jgi:hypothetical protein
MDVIWKRSNSIFRFSSQERKSSVTRTLLRKARSSLLRTAARERWFWLRPEPDHPAPGLLGSGPPFVPEGWQRALNLVSGCSRYAPWTNGSSQKCEPNGTPLICRVARPAHVHYREPRVSQYGRNALGSTPLTAMAKRRGTDVGGRGRAARRRGAPAGGNAPGSPPLTTMATVWRCRRPSRRRGGRRATAATRNASAVRR